MAWDCRTEWRTRAQPAIQPSLTIARCSTSVSLRNDGTSLSRSTSKLMRARVVSRRRPSRDAWRPFRPAMRKGRRTGRPRRREFQCPTRCSSTRRTRRKPGSSSSAVIGSKNSISNPRQRSRFAATSISPRSRGSNRRCRPPSSNTAAIATASWPSRRFIRTIIRSRSADRQALLEEEARQAPEEDEIEEEAQRVGAAAGNRRFARQWRPSGDAATARQRPQDETVGADPRTKAAQPDTHSDDSRRRRSRRRSDLRMRNLAATTIRSAQ